VRWELRPRIFLRTTEFLWQEGHTAHATQEDAAEYALGILHDVYRDFFVEMMALPVFIGRKTKKERFAGAVNTMTCEGMMRDGKALQLATSHELGQTFSKAFDITFTGEAGTVQHAWTTSWGSSTRMVGGLIMGHGDDNGLRLPPRLAPVQAVVILVREDEAAEAAAARLVRELEIQGVRVKLDAQTSTSFGRRLTDWELKGVPLRIEVGPREVAEGNVTLVRRDTNEKAPDAIGAVSGQAAAMLEQIQSDMLAAAMLEQKNHVVDVKTLLEALEAAQTGFARIPFEELGEDGEAELARSAVTVRCIQRVDGTVPLSEDEPGLMAVVARAY
jgi:prolyl-tRNA synthetase